MSSLGFGEVFRICNPTAKKFTWSNSLVQTRIDQIWISNKIKEGLKSSDIEEMDLITSSDHNLIWGEISTLSILEYNTQNLSKANMKKYSKKKNISDTKMLQKKTGKAIEVCWKIF